jgi:hypothetical protein
MRGRTPPANDWAGAAVRPDALCPRGVEVNEQELITHIERGLAALQREFADKVRADHVLEIGKDRFEALREHATITDFIPLLVYRQTREELLVCEPDEVHQAV